MSEASNKVRLEIITEEELTLVKIPLDNAVVLVPAKVKSFLEKVPTLKYPLLR